MTFSEIYKRGSLCVAVAIWPKRLSPRTRLATSPAGVVQPELGNRDAPSASSTGMGPRVCAPLSPSKIRGAEESPVGPFRSFPCSWFLWKFFQRLLAVRLTAREEHYPHVSCLWQASEAWDRAMWQNCSSGAVPRPLALVTGALTSREGSTPGKPSGVCKECCLGAVRRNSSWWFSAYPVLDSVLSTLHLFP